MTTSNSPLPPGRMGLPLLGETVEFIRDGGNFFQNHRKYGPIFKTHLFGRPTVVMGGAEAMRFVFTHDRDHFEASWPKSVATLLGEGSIAIQEGETHKRRRKILQQVFGHKQLAANLPLMDRIAGEHLERWARSRELTWSPLISRFTFHVACELILGTGSDIDELTATFETLIAGLFTLPVPLRFTKYGKALRARERLIARIQASVRDRAGRGTGGLEERSDALSVLLHAVDERGEKLPPAELCDQLLTLLFAGHETSSSAITSFCMLLAQHPSVLERLREEQGGVSIPGAITPEHIKKMPYLDQVIKEVLRFIPPVGGGFRKVVTTCEYGGYRIPKGWSLLYSVGGTHRDAQTFTDVDRFDPDRFAPDRAEDKRARFALVPFGGGARVCIGMEYARLEIAVLGARLIRDYAWELLPGQDLSLAVVPSPRPRSGLKARFWKR